MIEKTTDEPERSNKRQDTLVGSQGRDRVTAATSNIEKPNKDTDRQIRATKVHEKFKKKHQPERRTSFWQQGSESDTQRSST